MRTGPRCPADLAVLWARKDVSGQGPWWRVSRAASLASGPSCVRGGGRWDLSRLAADSCLTAQGWASSSFPVCICPSPATVDLWASAMSSGTPSLPLGISDLWPQCLAGSCPKLAHKKKKKKRLTSRVPHPSCHLLALVAFMGPGPWSVWLFFSEQQSEG